MSRTYLERSPTSSREPPRRAVSAISESHGRLNKPVPALHSVLEQTQCQRRVGLVRIIRRTLPLCSGALLLASVMLQSNDHSLQENEVRPCDRGP